MFDISLQLRAILERMCAILPEYSHINMNQVELSASRTRSRSRAGLLAYVSPLKFKGGTPIAFRKRGDFIYHFGMRPIIKNGTEILYVIYFLTPRFFNLAYAEKIKTLLHELYHIHPDFNGDFRRFVGYQRIHGKSLKDYDRIIEGFYERFISANPWLPEAEFLRYDFRVLTKKYGELAFPIIPEIKPLFLKKEQVPKMLSKSIYASHESHFEG